MIPTYNMWQARLNSIGKKFSITFVKRIVARYWPKVWIATLGDESDPSRINKSEKLTIAKVLLKSLHHC